MGGPLCPHLFSKLAKQVQTWLKPPWAGVSGKGALAVLVQRWSSQLHACGGCGPPNWHVLSVKPTCGGRGVRCCLRAWRYTVSRVNLPFSCCEVLRGSEPCMAWVGAQTSSVHVRNRGIFPKALNPVFRVTVEVWVLQLLDDPEPAA